MEPFEFVGTTSLSIRHLSRIPIHYQGLKICLRRCLEGSLLPSWIYHMPVSAAQLGGEVKTVHQPSIHIEGCFNTSVYLLVFPLLHLYFQRMMDILLQGLKNVCVYLDDILITGETTEDHLKKSEGSTQSVGEGWCETKKREVCVPHTPG